MKFKILLLVPICLLAVSLTSCVPNRLLSQIDDVTRSIDGGLAVGRDISKTLESLPDDASKLIRKDARDTINLAVAEGGLQGIALLEYTNRRMAAYLAGISKGLKAERKRISEGGEPAGTFENVLAKVLEEVVVSLPPAITNSLPDIVDIEQTASGLRMTLPEKVIRFYGWGLDSGDADFEVKLLGLNEAVLMDLRPHLTQTSNYKSVLDLSSLLSLPPKSLEGARIVYTEENGLAEAELYRARSEVPVRLLSPPPPTPPAQYKIRLDRIYGRSTDRFHGISTDGRGEPKVMVSVDGGEPKTAFNKYVHEGRSRSINKTYTFTNNVAITIIEQDGALDPDDKIGPVVIAKEQLYKMTKDFEKDDEKFTITWSVLE